MNIIVLRLSLNGKGKRMENKFRRILRKTPLETRLYVSNEMAFITLLSELGFRENKSWASDEDEVLQKLCDFAKKHTKHQLEQISSWEKDGKPGGTNNE